MDKDKSFIGFHVDTAIVRKLQAQATREDRSLSSLLRRLIDKHLKEQTGKDTPDEMPTVR